MHGWCTDGAQFTPKFVQILTIIYPQIATEPGPRRDLGEEHNTVQNIIRCQAKIMFRTSFSKKRFLDFEKLFY